MKKLFLILALATVFAFGADNAWAEEQSKEEMMALFINLKGFLCARVVNVSRLEQPNTFEVRCIEYRGGTGTVDYIVNLKTTEVFKR